VCSLSALIAETTSQELAEVITQVKNGDRSAYDEVYRGTILELKAWVAYRCHSWDMVEECLQRTYITAYRQLERFDESKPLVPWLKGIARNEIGKYLRENGRRSQRDLKAFLDAQVDRNDQEDLLLDDNQELAPQLADCLSRLGESLRTMIWRRYVEEKSVKDIATELGRTSNSLSVALHRARGALRTCLSKKA
jgi:RNA polymerase sigma-70 factor (ECF subfamily)